jgi:outer membrane receptor for ferrienterochelin and colicin
MKLMDTYPFRTLQYRSGIWALRMKSMLPDFRGIFGKAALLAACGLLPQGLLYAQSAQGASAVDTIYTSKSDYECSDASLNEARKSYEGGKFDDVNQRLKPCIASGQMRPDEHVQAYRLLALTAIAQDDFQAADYFAAQLLQINPSFETSVFDPPLFLNLIREVKSRDTKVKVTSVSKKAEDALEAPATVMVISQEDIRRRGYADLDALLGDLPGFDISRTYGLTYSSIYQRGYRANNTERTLLLVDGVEENDMWSNIMYLSRQYPITNIKRVEVIYGPASTMYGANAFVGVVNIITKDPSELIRDGNSFGVSAQANYGAWNTRYADITLAGRTEGLSFSVTGRTFRSDEMDLSRFPEFNYDPNDYNTVDYSFLDVKTNADKFVTDNSLSDNNPLYTVQRDPNGKAIAVNLTEAGKNAARELDKSGLQQPVNGQKLRFRNFSDDYLLGAKLRISDFTLSFQTWRKAAPTTTYYNDNNEASGDNKDLWAPQQSFVAAQYSKNLSDELSISNLMQYRLHGIDGASNAVYLLNYSNGSLGLADLAKNTAPIWVENEYYYQLSRQLRNETKAIWSPLMNMDIIAGLEVRSTQLQGNYIISGKEKPDQTGKVSGQAIPGGNNFDMVDAGIYVQGSYKPMEQVKVVLGGRFDYNRVRSDEGYGSAFNPRIAVVYTPGDFILKGIFATAVQNPSNLTKYATTNVRKANNPTLGLETVANIELSAGWKILPELFADIAVYNAEYDNVVGTGKTTLPSGEVTGQFQPIGALRIRGIQSNISYKTRFFSGYLNYTFTDPYNIRDESGPTNKRIGDIASHRINAGADIRPIEALNINIRMNYMSERITGPSTTVPANLEKFPSVLVFNATVGYDILPGFTLQVSCNNLLNTEYFDPGVRSADGLFYSSRTPQRERNFMLRALFDM